MPATAAILIEDDWRQRRYWSIGRAIALGLARAGAAIAAFARNEEKIQRVMDELRAIGVAGLAVKFDVSARSELQPALEKVEETLGPVSILVNNAGITVVGGASGTRQALLYQEIITRTTAGRFVNPDECAGTAAFLASRASDFVTGATICVDGGYSIR